MIDLLHFGICTKTSIILEGGPGQGKQKAISYISNLLDYEVENIVITNNFTIEDLFKKTILSKKDGTIAVIQVFTKLSEILSKSNSKFCEKIYKNEGDKIKEEEKNNSKPVLFVFHNIHKASADVLSKISCIFNEKKKSHNYFLIGLINIKESFIERNSYYDTYFYNSIYYKVDSTNLDLSFCQKIYNEKDISFSILKYFKNNNKDEENIFTITDLIKFIALKKCSDFDDAFLEDILFNKGPNTSKEPSFDIDINYKNNNNELLLELVEKLNRKSIKSFSLETTGILTNFEEEKNTLSFDQKKALIVLGLAVKSKFPCILEGQTGVGKSHLIQLFAKFLGKKITIIDLNKDNDKSLMTKRYVYKKYDKNEEKEIKNILDDLLGNTEDLRELTINDKIKKIREKKLD